MGKKLFIWGAGDIGKRVFIHLSENWDIVFVDTQERLGNMRYQGKKVISVKEYLEKYSNQFILIAHLHEAESISVLQDKGIANYFTHCDLPGEFREPYIKRHLQTYILDCLGRRSDYVLYGLGIYSLIIDDWIFSHFGIHPYILKQNSISRESTEAIVQQYDGLRIIDDLHQLNGIQEICVCLDNYSELKKKKIFAGYKITDIYDCTDRIACYHNPEIKKFHKIHDGQRCFIVATGPSLKIEDLNLLEEKREICISMNSICYAFDKTDWTPDYYVVSDHRWLEENPQWVRSMPVKEKFFSDNSEKFWQTVHEKNIYHFHHHYEYCFNRLPKFSDDFSKRSYLGATVTYTCMQLAVYMGFKKIYLLGVDFSGDGATNGKYGHFYEEDELVATCFRHQVQSAYISAKQYADLHGIKIYNATRGGELEVFPRVDFDTLLSNEFV